MLRNIQERIGNGLDGMPVVRRDWHGGEPPLQRVLGVWVASIQLMYRSQLLRSAVRLQRGSVSRSDRFTCTNPALQFPSDAYRDFRGSNGNGNALVVWKVISRGAITGDGAAPEVERGAAQREAKKKRQNIENGIARNSL